MTQPSLWWVLEHCAGEWGFPPCTSHGDGDTSLSSTPDMLRALQPSGPALLGAWPLDEEGDPVYLGSQEPTAYPGQLMSTLADGRRRSPPLPMWAGSLCHAGGTSQHPSWRGVRSLSASTSLAFFPHPLAS